MFQIISARGLRRDVLVTVLASRFSVKPMWVGADVGDGAEWSSHAWLEVQGFTVDITTDQFDEEPVIVERCSGWYDALKVTTAPIIL